MRTMTNENEIVIKIKIEMFYCSSCDKIVAENHTKNVSISWVLMEYAKEWMYEGKCLCDLGWFYVSNNNKTETETKELFLESLCLYEYAALH